MPFMFKLKYGVVCVGDAFNCGARGIGGYLDGTAVVGAPTKWHLFHSRILFELVESSVDFLHAGGISHSIKKRSLIHDHTFRDMENSTEGLDFTTIPLA
jgi:hypothetical protein